jgi:hypothetical protein
MHGADRLGVVSWELGNYPSSTEAYAISLDRVLVSAVVRSRHFYTDCAWGDTFAACITCELGIHSQTATNLHSTPCHYIALYYTTLRNATQCSVSASRQSSVYV